MDTNENPTSTAANKTKKETKTTAIGEFKSIEEFTKVSLKNFGKPTYNTIFLY